MPPRAQTPTNGRRAVQPDTPQPLEALAFTEVGASGLKQFVGILAEEELRDLQGTQGPKRYREMLLDPVVRGGLRAIELLARRTPWHEEPASTEPVDREAATYLGTVREDMSHTWADLISDAFTMLPFGWSYLETVYKIRGGPSSNPMTRSRYRDGRIGVRKLALRAQDSLDRWEFDPHGGVKGLWQRAAPDYQVRFIPIEKALLFRTSAHKGNPEGESLLRGAYSSWYKKRRIENIEAIGVERDLAGLPIAWVPPAWLRSDASSGDQTLLSEVKKIVRNIRRDEQEGLVMPLAYDEQGRKIIDLTLLTTGGRRQFETSDIVKRYDLDIALSMLADTLLVGHEKVGSYSLASSKTTLFATAIGALLDIVEDVLNRYLVPRLFELNGWATEALPQWRHGDIESADLAELGAYLNTLAAAGAELFPDFELTQHLLRMAGLPAKVGEHETFGTPEEEEEREEPTVVVDEPVAEPDPSKALAASPEADLQEAGLNGAQVNALLGIVQEVATNKLPAASAQALIEAAFPLLSPTLVARMLSGVQGFAPEPESVTEPSA